MSSRGQGLYVPLVFLQLVGTAFVVVGVLRLTGGETVGISVAVKFISGMYFALCCGVWTFQRALEGDGFEVCVRLKPPGRLSPASFRCGPARAEHRPDTSAPLYARFWIGLLPSRWKVCTVTVDTGGLVASFPLPPARCYTVVVHVTRTRTSDRYESAAMRLDLHHARSVPIERAKASSLSNLSRRLGA